MNLDHEVLPCEANNSCGIGNGSAMGEGLIELEVIGMSGECMLTLNVADSMRPIATCGRWFWTKFHPSRLFS